MFLGDSTLFYLMRSLTILFKLWQTQPTALRAAFRDSMASPEAFDDTIIGLSRHFGATEALQYEDNSTRLLWDGHAGVYTGTACDFSGPLARLRSLRPHLLVFNFGFHWLHLVGWGTREPGACSVQRWLGYEMWLDEMAASAQQAGVRILLYKTCNLVCEQYFTDDRTHRGLSLLLTGHKAEFALPCEAHLSLRASDIPVSHRADYCANGSFSADAVRQLNERATRHVHSVLQPKYSKLGMRVAVFDDYSLQQCDDTNNYGHFHIRGLTWLRLRALGNIVRTSLGSPQLRT